MKLVPESMFLEKADVCSVWGSWEPSGVFLWDGRYRSEGLEARKREDEQESGSVENRRWLRSDSGLSLSLGSARLFMTLVHCAFFTQGRQSPFYYCITIPRVIKEPTVLCEDTGLSFPGMSSFFFGLAILLLIQS